MVAFVPISPSAARQLLTGISAIDDSVLLSDFVEAGLIRAYARVVETLSADGGHTELRDAQIQRGLWKRIVAEGKVGQLLSAASVKLDGDGLVGGRPAVVITGVRFNEANIRDVVVQHGDVPPAEPVRAPLKKPRPTDPIKQAVLADAPPLIKLVEAAAPPQGKARVGLPESTVMVSIKDTMDILDVSRGTIGNLMKRGVLQNRKVGTRTLILADSIRAIMRGEKGASAELAP